DADERMLRRRVRAAETTALQIGAGTERGARPGQHDGAHARLGERRREVDAEARDQLLGERVPALRLVQRDPGRVTPDLVENGVAHDPSSKTTRRAPASTCWPGSTGTSLTTPSSGAR